jgi:hypothetical protein
MSAFEDDIRRAMTGHDDEAPRAADLLRSLGQAARPRRRLAGWYVPFAVAAAVAVLVLGSVWVGKAVAGHQPQRFSASGAGGRVTKLTCPGRYAKQAPWVPAKPAGVDGRSRLVPQQTPSSALICGYDGSNEAKQQAGWALSGQRSLTGNLAGLAAQLSWQARLPAGRQLWCAGAGGRQVNYLVGLTYPGGGTIWVTAADDSGECITTANGEFTSIDAIGSVVSKAFASGRWPTRSPVSCNGTGETGRLGQETAMVPAGAISLTICAPKAHKVTSGYQALVRALDRLPTGPSDGSCSESPGSPGAIYQLLFSYAEGPAVSIFINSRCHPAIDNNNLESASASSVMPIIQQLLKAT